MVGPHTTKASALHCSVLSLLSTPPGEPLSVWGEEKRRGRTVGIQSNHNLKSRIFSPPTTIKLFSLFLSFSLCARTIALRGASLPEPHKGENEVLQGLIQGTGKEGLLGFFLSVCQAAYSLMKMLRLMRTIRRPVLIPCNFPQSPLPASCQGGLGPPAEPRLLGLAFPHPWLTPLPRPKQRKQQSLSRTLPFHLSLSRYTAIY